jgi:hypothetical protein
VLLKADHLLKICQNTFDVPTLTGASVHPPEKFERTPFLNGCSYVIKNYGVEVTFSGMTSLLNFIKIYQLAGRSTVLEPLLCSVE